MFEGLYHCRTDETSTCCDFVCDGVYFTFVFQDGKCFEWNESK